MKLERAIIVDLDGTLADCEHRVSHLHKSPKDWDSFYSGLMNDSLNKWCAELIDAMKYKDYKILFVTGREEKYREVTISWLLKNKVEFDHLIMRELNDRRDDFLVKEDLYNKKIKNHYDILFVIDDRASVVNKWRELGLVCLQCDIGNF